MVISLCIGMIPYIYAFNNPNPYNTISSFCKVRTYIAQSCVMMYRWLMIAACIDRYAHTKVSAYFQRLTHARVAFRIILVITIIWLILPFHQLVWIDVKGNACTYINISVRVYNSVFTIILGGLLPSLIMLIFTLLIQHNLTLKRTRLFRLRNILEQDRAQHLLRSHDQQACVMLFVQIFVYIITNLPWAIYLVYAASTSYMIKSTEHLAMDVFVKFLMEFILQIYPVVSFPMYTVASSTLRQELIKTLKSFLIFV